MNLRVDSFKPLGASLNINKPQKADKTSSFGEILAGSLKDVNSLQSKADVSIENLAAGKSQNIHETMIDISKADMAFRLTVAVRNKVIEAYQEVMRMSI